MTITIEITSATQYATAYDGEKPVATAQRRRTYETGPVWKVYDTKGELLFKTYFTPTSEQMAHRIERALKKRAGGQS